MNKKSLISNNLFILQKYKPCRRIRATPLDVSPGDITTKTYLYSCDTLKPHFYTVKLGFTRVYINFLLSA